MAQHPTDSPASHSKTNPKRVVETVSTEHHELRRPGAQSPTSTPTPPSQEPLPKPVAELDSNYTSIGLPSGFAFYSFKSLSIRPLKAGDQAKLHQAATTGSIRRTVEAISATLGDGVSAMQLVPHDFYYLMYWLRTQSFLRTPMVVTAYCSDPDHNEWVMTGKPSPTSDEPDRKVPMTEDSLKMSIHVNKTTLEVSDLDMTKVVLPESLTYADDEVGKLPVYVETMEDIVYAADNWAELKDVTDLDTIQWLAGYAAFLKPQTIVSDTGKQHKETLKERMDRVAELDPDVLADLDLYIRSVTSYGVSESTKVTCKECGASNTVLIPFDARTFLPSTR